MLTFYHPTSRTMNSLIRLLQIEDGLVVTVVHAKIGHFFIQSFYQYTVASTRSPGLPATYCAVIWLLAVARTLAN